MKNTREREKSLDFDAIKISVASPDDIKKWSFGEVTKPETINYRTQKPEREGLFDERIFGPIKDYECYCGKYKKIRYKGVVCDKCGVEITKSQVRRERMGHIELSVPCVHIWYLRGVPSRLGLILNMTSRDLEKIIYFGSYLITEVNEELKKKTLERLEEEFLNYKARLKTEERKKKRGIIERLKSSKDPRMENLLSSYRYAKEEIGSLQRLKTISEERYHEFIGKYGEIIKVGIGAEAIFEVLKSVDLKDLEKNLEAEILEARGQKSKKMAKRLCLIKDLNRAEIRPEWLMVTLLPIIPPDLRPMVQLDGGRFAASDLNDLYRRVINRNNRLKRLKEQGAPEVIQRNEKRMLQEAVDALIDNSARKDKAAATVGGRRKLRSLSDMLKGKQGRFRQNLLGKRVDYSARSVIVVGPELGLDQCGIPKTMALELLKPFVIGELIRGGYAHNVKNATKLIEDEKDEVWDILEKLAKKHFVLLNRAPTLHRLGVQAFKPVLIEGKAIQIHPLVNEAYNADFDGDQMAVYLPLSKESQKEAREIMFSVTNVLKPSSGEPVISPQKDMVMGCYFLTTFKKNALGEGMIFSDKNEAVLAHRNAKVSVRAKISVLIDGVIVRTSVGRILFNQIIPKDFGFINSPLERKALKGVVARIFENYGSEKTAVFVDRIKKIGFYYACHAGITISVPDIVVPKEKKGLIRMGEKKVDEITKQYSQGLITDEERYIKVVELWTNIKNKLEAFMLKDIRGENPINFMVFSGARGSLAQVTQLSGMKGLVVNPAGDIIELPIKANYREGLDVYEYFISTHGARKGRTDTALRTSEAGYLTRRLIDVSQDMIVMNDDCGSTEGIEIEREESEMLGEDFSKRIFGRVAATAIKDADKIIQRKGKVISQEVSEKIEKKKRIKSIFVFSPLTCKNKRGICKKCYGADLARGELVAEGEAVGVIAAQAIGEPGTQLTMRTFHVGGVAGEDITQGLPRVEELFEARSPRNIAPIAEISGRVSVKEFEDKKVITITALSDKVIFYDLKKGYRLIKKDGAKVKNGDVLAQKEKKGRIVHSGAPGILKIEAGKIKVIHKSIEAKEYTVGPLSALLVADEGEVKKGEVLTEGHLNLDQLRIILGKREAQKYIIREIQAIYSSQGQSINDKHFEIVIRQMFSKVRIVDSGDSDLIEGKIIDHLKLNDINTALKKRGKKTVKSEDLLLGITKISLNTESFLSAASFQETTSVLIEASTTGSIDHLRGLKENVIIGKLIPAGTGYN